ncbi:ankyrin repeat domain-containing protein [Thalassobaculum sp. OXR-137]|uniref:ankyrin repeat domain-containing protein n=1 Tax=Thalassobaculum sp. OXR-137 TaxID=3100173 RepID=UPI002AC94E4D|nr:ankyrin repeat domain-containing protein [Thalassobaculum sp. OXR-137]WPZ36855.1 ankyrin repeat domain-containing protein [Thalassobaculum sp. OXR-137]
MSMVRPGWPAIAVLALVLGSLGGAARAGSLEDAIRALPQDPPRAVDMLRAAAPTDLLAAFHLIVALDVWLPQTPSTEAEKRAVMARAVAKIQAGPPDDYAWPYWPDWMSEQGIQEKDPLEQDAVLEVLRYVAHESGAEKTDTFALDCKVLKRRPAYLELAEPYFGSTRDNFLPVFECDDAEWALPPEAERYFEALSGRFEEALDVPSLGTIRYAYYRSRTADDLAIRVIPETLLADAERGEPQATHRPLETWSMLNLSNRTRFAPVAVLFDAALPVLAERYRRTNGLAEAQAVQAAHAALLLPAYEGYWAAPDRSGLRYMILEGAPLADIAALIDGAPDRASVPMTMLRVVDDEAAWDFVGGMPDPLVSVAVRRPDVLTLLLEKGPLAPPVTAGLARGDQTVDPNARNWIGKTPLMTAAELDRPDSVRLLLEHGADPNAVLSHSSLWHSDRTALMYAAAKASAPVIEMLLAAGADPAVLDSQGFGVLDYLQGRGPSGPNPRLNAAEIDRLSAGLPATDRTRERQTALMRAAATEDGELVVQLLTAGSDKAARDAAGLKAIDYAEGRSPLGRLESDRYSGYPSPGVFLGD